MKETIVVKSTVGLHASLAAKIVQAASKYSVDINLHYHNKTIDVKSIWGLMSLAIPSGENVVIEAAYFDALSVRKTSKRLGLKSESSTRFERVVD